MKRNRPLIHTIALVAGFCYIIYGLVVKGDEEQVYLNYAALSTFNLVCIYFLVSNGSILSTQYWRAMLLASSVALIGVLAFIQDWTGGKLILSIALLSFPLIYIVRFARKQRKDTLDVLKLVWIVSFFGLKALILFHIIPGGMNLISTIILLIACMFYLLRKKKVTNETDFGFMKQSKDLQ